MGRFDHTIYLRAMIQRPRWEIDQSCSDCYIPKWVVVKGDATPIWTSGFTLILIICFGSLYLFLKGYCLVSSPRDRDTNGVEFGSTRGGGYKDEEDHGCGR